MQTRWLSGTEASSSPWRRQVRERHELVPDAYKVFPLHLHVHTPSDEVGCVPLSPGSQGVQIKAIFKKQLGVFVIKDVDVLITEVHCWLPGVSPRATLT